MQKISEVESFQEIRRDSEAEGKDKSQG